MRIAPWDFGEGGPALLCILLGHDTFTFIPGLVKPHCGRQLTREERVAKLQDLQRQEGSGECVWNPSKQIQGPTRHNEAKVVRVLRTHQGEEARAPTPADDKAAIANEPVVYVADKNSRNLSRATKQHETYSRITSITLVHWLVGGEDLRCDKDLLS